MLPVDDVGAIRHFLKVKVADLFMEPEFHWHGSDPGTPYMLDPDGTPAVRVAVANVEPDSDIWKGLRSPAAVGKSPLGFREIWAFYAANNVRRVRRDGSPNYLAMPEAFEQATERYGRAVIVSALLPVAPAVFVQYARGIESGGTDGHDLYRRASGDVGKLVARAVARLSVALLAESRAVVCMNPEGAGKVADFSLPKSRTGKYHGPCNDPFPQGSIAVMTGLMQFGVSRVPMRDEPGADGNVVRMMGHYSSSVAFDEAPPVTDGRGGVVYLGPSRIEEVRRISDFTVTDREVVEKRFCAYGRREGETGASVCARCLRCCPSGAIANSSPRPDGKYPEAVLRQKHRFDAGFLDFDFANCSRERNDKQNLYSEYVCARCVAMCAARGASGLGERHAAVTT